MGRWSFSSSLTPVLEIGSANPSLAMAAIGIRKPYAETKVGEFFFYLYDVYRLVGWLLIRGLFQHNRNTWNTFPGSEY